MSGGRSSALPAFLAAAGVLVAAAAWFLRAGPAVPPPPPGRSGNARSGPLPAPPAPGDAAPAATDAPAPPPVPGEGEEEASGGGGPWALPALPPAGGGWALLRFLDAETGEPVPAAAKPVVVLVARTDRGILRLPQRLHAGDGGRAVVVAVGGTGERPGENLYFTKEETAALRYEVLAFGYAPLTDLARSDLEGEHDLRLAPLPPAARGVLEAGPGLGKGVLRCDLFPAAGSASVGGVFFTGSAGSVRAPSLPREFGPFTIPALPPGNWTLVVRHQQGGGVQARATAVFEAGAETADLGVLVVHAPAVIRARVIGNDGTGMLDPGMRVQKAGGASAEAPPSEEPDAEGWVEFRGLEPDTDYEVLCSFEGLVERVRTPADGGGPVVVELRSEIRGVRCRLRFTVKGEEPVKWGAVVMGPTLDADAWRKDGLLEQEMAPGEYAFGILAQVPGSETMARYFAKVVVPDQPTFDATVDLGDR